MTKPRELPTLHVETDGFLWFVEATSYGRTSPSGLGSFVSREEAKTAMNKLKPKMQGGKKDDAPDLSEAVWKV